MESRRVRPLQQGGQCFPVYIRGSNRRLHNPHGYPQTSRPRKPGRRGLDEEAAGGHEKVGRLLWSPLLVVQKPCQPDQGKRYQEGPVLDPPVAAAAAEHVGASQGCSRSGRASLAGQPVGEMTAGWSSDQDQDQDQV